MKPKKQLQKTLTHLNDTQKQDKGLCYDISLKITLSEAPLEAGSFQGCDAEIQNTYQDPILAQIHQKCMWLDKVVRQLQAMDTTPRHLSKKHPKSVEQCVWYQTQNLVSILSEQLLPKMEMLLNEHKRKHS